MSAGAKDFYHEEYYPRTPHDRLNRRFGYHTSHGGDARSRFQTQELAGECTDAAAQIRGVALPVDGGWTAQ
jgi:hypothetical protein